MLRLIKANLASTGKPHLRNGAPPFLMNRRALHALHRQRSQLGFQVITQEIELMDAIPIGRVECGFCRRQGEDQPAMTCIHGFESEDVAEECAVRLGIFTVDDDPEII